jgi:hypothetical protein
MLGCSALLRKADLQSDIAAFNKHHSFLDSVETLLVEELVARRDSILVLQAQQKLQTLQGERERRLHECSIPSP